MEKLHSWEWESYISNVTVSIWIILEGVTETQWWCNPILTFGGTIKKWKTLGCHLNSRVPTTCSGSDIWYKKDLKISVAWRNIQSFLIKSVYT